MVDFKTISIRGRIAYGIMCAESYALTKYPDRDWRPLFQVLWGISRDDVYWDEWASAVIDRLPEMVLSDDPRDWEGTDPETLDQCRALYQGMPEAFNAILSGIVDIEEADAYTVVEGYGAAALESLRDVIDVMQAEGVELPDPAPVAAMRFEGDGRGGPFDARPLSRIL
jgi:hypothetical protein